MLSNPPRASRKGRGNPGAPASLSPSIDIFCPGFEGIKCSEIFLIPLLLGCSGSQGLMFALCGVRIGLLLQNALIPHLPKDLATPRRNQVARNTPVSRTPPSAFPFSFSCRTEGFWGGRAPNFKPHEVHNSLPTTSTVTSQGK